MPARTEPILFQNEHETHMASTATRVLRRRGMRRKMCGAARQLRAAGKCACGRCAAGRKAVVVVAGE